MPTVYCGIDGTNNFDRQLYKSAKSAHEFTSYVKRIGPEFSFGRHGYIKGTTDTLNGSDTDDKARGCARWVEENVTELTGARRTGVFLAGFSRGGMSAILASNLLGEKGIVVDGLFLLDAVNRTFSLANARHRMPSTNVRWIYHIYRDETSASRPLFGSVDKDLTEGSPLANLTTQAIHLNHGAIGGWKAAENMERTVTAGRRRAARKRTYISETRGWLPDNISRVSPAREDAGHQMVWNILSGWVREARARYYAAHPQF
ncbi:alpha/beta hydrolase [Aliiruegeria sabulilitoris]|uniref:alpha/beta hydrolase n=1 Tax=Aliiruegeria sabulilitoris TaxID=1510458 RepID=UPI000834380D|nr:alpha/beta hydrolase [Aliiruegeria sabulilitoris]NDR56308.1 alpha/beta hydrolase [Pseudoruegeria sp. M32A2M]